MAHRNARADAAKVAKALAATGTELRPASGGPLTAAQCQAFADTELNRPEHKPGPDYVRNAAANVSAGPIAQLRAAETAERARRAAQMKELTGRD